MIRKWAGQLTSIAVTLVLVLSLVFIGMRLLPGDAASLRAGTEASDAQVTAIRDSLGLAVPWLSQFATYWQGLARGDLGTSFREQRPVTKIVAERLPVTIQLALCSLTLTLLLGLGLGMIAGLNPGHVVERVVLAATTLGLTLPGFWLGFLLLLLFAVQRDWFPLIGFDTTGGTLARLHALTLPALTLAIPNAAQLARLTRAEVLELRHADFIRTARSKGLARGAVIQHITANALPKVLPLVALTLGGLLTGTIVVEQVFGLPGLGLAMLGAIAARDYPVVQGITIVVVLVYITVNALADALQVLSDPRLRYG
ncbi:MAG: ABC transporter permease [Deinococcota bacterium]